MPKKSKRQYRGSTIIEVMIAATLISVAIIAALALSNLTQKQTDFARDLNQGTYYNTQSIDWLRNMRTLDGWASFVNELSLDASGSTVKYCLNTLPDSTVDFAALTYTETCDAATITGTQFQREMTLTLNNSPVDSVSVVVTTYWQDRQRSTVTETKLTEW